MIKILILMATLAVVVHAFTPSDTCNQQTWVTNGPVNTIVPAGGKVYIGGSFSRVGPFVNGSFDSAHSVVRNNIAALDAKTGIATDWDPNAGNAVYTLVVGGATVYVGGEFDSIGGQERSFIAALDTSTGNALSWNPNADCRVKTMVVAGSTVYAGGVFDSIDGKERYGIAAIDAKTGHVTAWAANTFYFDNQYDFFESGWVYSLAASGTTLFIGGYFDSIGDQRIISQDFRFANH